MAPKRFSLKPKEGFERKKMWIPKTFTPSKDLEEKTKRLLRKAPLASTLRDPRIPYLRNNNAVCYLDFEIPVKDSDDGRNVVECLKELLAMKYSRLVKDYFSKSKKAFKEIKHSGWDIKIPFLKMLASLDDGYLLSNKITLKIFKEYRYTFEQYVRDKIKNEHSLPKGKNESNSPYLKTDFWSKPLTLNYNTKEGFKTENPEDMEKFSFLRGLLNDFLKEKVEVFKKLKSDANLIYSLEIRLCPEGFLCSLKEESVVKKAGLLNHELYNLEDKPKELADKIDELQERADEILSKTGVENIVDVLPLDYYVKLVRGIEFSENGLRAFLFNDLDQKSKNYRPTHFCIIFDKDKRKLEKAYETRDNGAINYFNGNNMKSLLERLYEEQSIYFKYTEMEEGIKRIEDDCLKKQGVTFKNELGRILKLKNLELPLGWYVLRDLMYSSPSNLPQSINESVICFVKQREESEIVTKMLDYMKSKHKSPHTVVEPIIIKSGTGKDQGYHMEDGKIIRKGNTMIYPQDGMIRNKSHNRRNM